MEVVSLIGMTLGASWASGINLYAAVTTLGLLGITEVVILPPGWEVLTHPLVILAGALMYLVEFTADKVPGGDSAWDAIHTFVRIPAGALLAFSAVHDIDPALGLAASLVGGSLSAANHSAKAGLRLAINTSPEPFSNWAASTAEDGISFTGVFLAIFYPVVFLVLLLFWIVLLLWLIPRVWRYVRMVYRRVKAFLNGTSSDSGEAGSGHVQGVGYRSPGAAAPEPAPADPAGPVVIQVKLEGRWHDLKEYPAGTPEATITMKLGRLRSSGLAGEVRVVRIEDRLPA